MKAKKMFKTPNNAQSEVERLTKILAQKQADHAIETINGIGVLFQEAKGGNEAAEKVLKDFFGTMSEIQEAFME